MLQSIKFDLADGVLTFSTASGDVYSVRELPSGAVSLLGGTPGTGLPRGLVICASSDVFAGPISDEQIARCAQKPRGGGEGDGAQA